MAADGSTRACARSALRQNGAAPLAVKAGRRERLRSLRSSGLADEKSANRGLVGLRQHRVPASNTCERARDEVSEATFIANGTVCCRCWCARSALRWLLPNDTAAPSDERLVDTVVRALP